MTALSNTNHEASSEILERDTHTPKKWKKASIFRSQKATNYFPRKAVRMKISSIIIPQNVDEKNTTYPGKKDHKWRAGIHV